VDRGHLAQSLEYAGWALNTNLDELAMLFHGGEAGFWAEWQDFTETPTPVIVQRNPRLYLVARTFHQRTSEAMDFLLQHRVPIDVLRMAFYVDDGGRRFLDMEWETEPESAFTPTPAPVSDRAAPSPDSIAESPISDVRDFREVTLAEVAAAVQAPATLVRTRPRKGERHEATLLDTGLIRLPDGRDHRSPSGAAMAAAEVVSYDGWYAWRLGENGPP
jgi:hypothetical protein